MALLDGGDVDSRCLRGGHSGGSGSVSVRVFRVLGHTYRAAPLASKVKVELPTP